MYVKNNIYNTVWRQVTSLYAPSCLCAPSLRLSCTSTHHSFSLAWFNTTKCWPLHWTGLHSCIITLQLGINLELHPTVCDVCWAGQTPVLIWVWSCGGTGRGSCRWRCTEPRSEPSSSSEHAASTGLLGYPVSHCALDRRSRSQTGWPLQFVPLQRCSGPARVGWCSLGH